MLIEQVFGRLDCLAISRQRSTKIMKEGKIGTLRGQYTLPHSTHVPNFLSHSLIHAKIPRFCRSVELLQMGQRYTHRKVDSFYEGIKREILEASHPGMFSPKPPSLLLFISAIEVKQKHLTRGALLLFPASKRGNNPPIFFPV